MHILKESTQLVVIFPNVPLSYCSHFFCTAFVPNYYLLRLVVCPLLSGMTHCTNVLWWDFNLFMMTLFLPLPMGNIKLSHSSSGLLQLPCQYDVYLNLPIDDHIDCGVSQCASLSASGSFLLQSSVPLKESLEEILNITERY